MRGRKAGEIMPHYEKNFITQAVIRADLKDGTAPIMAQLGEGVLAALADYPQRGAANRTRTEVRIQKTPQGPVKDTRTVNFIEHSFLTADRTGQAAVSSDHIYVATRRYESYAPLRDGFLELLEAVTAQWPGLYIRRLGMRYINEIKLPDADAGPGLGADFWEHYVNPFLLGGLRFAANAGALARHMCTTELNYGTDRATIRYGIFNGDYPKPIRRREFVLDVDTFCLTDLAPTDLGPKLDDYHKAACQVFEAAVTDALRTRMGRI